MANFIKLFMAVSSEFCIKLKCPSLASFFARIVWCLWVREESTKVKHLSGAPLQGKLLALPSNNELGWKGLPGANTLVYYKNSQLTAIKSLITLAPGLCKGCR
jgi:hypothetical protein